MARMFGYGLMYLYITGNGWKWIEIAGMAGYGWKWLEIAGLGLKWDGLITVSGIW